MKEVWIEEVAVAWYEWLAVVSLIYAGFVIGVVFGWRRRGK